MMLTAILACPHPSEAAVPSALAELTATEARWLQAALPVLAYSREQGLPLDIVIKPDPAAGETPLGMAWVDGRCKLVLAMRGNPEAQATLERIPAGLQAAVVEAIAAHELAHCWRHVQQVWGTLPAGVSDDGWRARVTPEQAELLDDMWRTRREEAYADLVGLAWTLRHHAERYAAVHAWQVALRARQAVDTGPHDTRVWVQLAQDRAAFTQAPSLFEQVLPLWRAGLLAGAGLRSVP
jgi:hypothetical protein